MPPAISDEESSESEIRMSTARSSRRSPSIADGSASDEEPTAQDDHDDKHDDDDDDDVDNLGSEGGDESDEDVYTVEAIKNHMIDEDGSLKFQVKWEGYEAKKDLTWEPEENLKESATEILDEYYERLGGRQSIFEQTAQAARGKKRGRGGTNGGATSKRSRKNGSHPAATAAPASVKPWTPPAGSWEDDIESLDACEEEAGKLVVFLNWKNGKKTKHETHVVYKKCPQKMLQFYERHVKIIRDDAKVT